MAQGNPKFAGITDGQILQLFETIATQANLMANICRLEAQRNSEHEIAFVLHAFDSMLRSIGAMADIPTGGDCVGDFAAWMVGPLFHRPQGAGGAA
jgi:hypothetical protein